MRKKFEEAFKARVAIEAIKCEKTLSQISSEYGVHSNLVSRWKQELLKGASEIFGKPNNSNKNGQDEYIIRRNPDTHSGIKRTPKPVFYGHLFRK